ncbi:4'-phosphopantetheinyl transferase superfamily protein [Candidatus Dependentiae bacterium]|nr:4'-phosphopantetheinyl transferase superfamily protein [Candidatus Dependentiae bacterium]
MNQFTLWKPQSFPPFLEDSEAHVWRVGLPLTLSFLASLKSYLSEAELERLGSLVSEKDKQGFISSRGLLRFLLGGYLGCMPQEVMLSAGPHGKPLVLGSAISCNLSHSGEYLLYAFAKHCAVGVDCEQIRIISNPSKFMRAHFSDQERRSIMTRPIPEQPEAFFRLWTHKEAYLKALGKGFSFPIDEDMHSVVPLQAAVLLAANNEYSSQWYLENIPLDKGYCAAIVLEHPRILLLYDLQIIF